MAQFLPYSSILAYLALQFNCRLDQYSSRPSTQTGAVSTGSQSDHSIILYIRHLGISYYIEQQWLHARTSMDGSDHASQL